MFIRLMNSSILVHKNYTRVSDNETNDRSLLGKVYQALSVTMVHFSSLVMAVESLQREIRSIRYTLVEKLVKIVFDENVTTNIVTKQWSDDLVYSLLVEATCGLYKNCLRLNRFCNE